MSAVLARMLRGQWLTHGGSGGRWRGGAANEICEKVVASYDLSNSCVVVKRQAYASNRLVIPFLGFEVLGPLRTTVECKPFHERLVFVVPVQQRRELGLRLNVFLTSEV